MPQDLTEFRKLPAVDALLHEPAIGQLAERYGSNQLTAVIRAELDSARQKIRQGGTAPTADAWPRLVARRLTEADQSSLQPVINATGVIVHTNLGRAPLSHSALAAVRTISSGYNTLEYDLDAGQRGSRHDHPRRRLCDLTGAEDALVVNNNAAAVFLVLAALCQGQQVVVSRGQLVEIGGGFRIPDVLRQSGAELVEVGTTNRTHPQDYEDAVNDRTAALMRIHASNFRQIGFVTTPELTELVAIAHQSQRIDGSRPLVIDDLGSGTLLDTTPYGLSPEPTIQTSVQAGADVVTFSGDKLLGGPQAGLILGKARWIQVLRRHPLARALRVDKMTLAALDATLLSYQRGRATEEIPVWRMISANADSLKQRAISLQERLAVSHVQTAVIPGESTVGGGSLPGETQPTWLLTIEQPEPDQAAAALRQGDPPIICRIQHDALVFDLRTVLPQQEQILLDAVGKLVL